MRRTEGFTLIELMVVVSIIALLAMMLVPALQSAIEMANRAGCVSNLNGVSKGLTLYKGAQDDQYPMLPGSGWDTVPDGTNYKADTGTPFTTANPGGDGSMTRSVTSLMFMLIRDNQNPKIFTCRSDGYAKADPTPQTSITTTTPQTMQFNWDFSSGQVPGTAGGLGSKRNVSYSFQCPITRTGSVSATTSDFTGIPSNADSSLAIMADRTPGSSTSPNSGAPVVAGNFTGIATVAWTSSITGDEVKKYNSQNHRGEVMNVLYAGGNVGQPKTPNCGPTTANGKQDCIFSTIASVTTGDGSDAGVLGNSNRIATTSGAYVRDSYLWGGAGK